MRNATCRGPFKDLIKVLSKNEIFVEISKLTGTSARVKKMEDQELVLRLFALAHENGYEKYKGGIKNFLTQEMKKFNELNVNEINVLRENFLITVAMIQKKLGDTPFAKYRVNDDVEYDQMSKFNVAVFDAIAVPFYQLAAQKKDVSINYDNVKELFRDSDFFDSIEGGTNDVKKFITRISKGLQVIS